MLTRQMVDICSEHSYPKSCLAENCIKVQEFATHEEGINLTEINNGLAYRVHRRLATHPRIKTRKALAEYLSIAPSTFSRMLSNPERRLNQATFDKLVNFLQCEPAELDVTLENDALSEQDLHAKHERLEAIAREQSLQIRELGQRIDDAKAMIEAMERRQRWEAGVNHG